MQIEAQGANQAAKEACGRSKKPAGRDWGVGGAAVAESQEPDLPPPIYAHLLIYILYVWASLLSWWRIRLQCRRPGSIPALERSAGEGIGYPLQYSWASLVTQLVKNPPVMRETWV